MPNEGTRDRTTIDSTQRAKARLPLARADESRRVAALTILHHPDLQRIGERALLGELLYGRDCAISRRQPGFAPPESGATGQPLGDPHLSRRPFVLRRAGDDSIELDPAGSGTRLVCDGAPVDQPRRLSHRQLGEGSVLELADTLVLLLHQAVIDGGGPPRARHGIVGESDAAARLRRDIEQVADLEVPVLIRGETGTGKELVAEAIHRASGRRGELVAVNLGGIPPAIAASELFGAAKGSFTGASTSKTGYFERAARGTLLLDEIGEAPPEVQVLLLRALESGEIQPVGEARPRRVHVRWLAATDADLEDEVRAGRFRGPLLHRLAGYEIWLQPLRRRREDLGRLLLHFLRLELAVLGEQHIPPRNAARDWLSASLVARLARFSWPGNVRQLRNVARQLVIGHRGRPRLEMLPSVERLLATDARPEDPPPAVPELSDHGLSPAASSQTRRKPATIRADELRRALVEAGWNLKATAASLGISRTSLYELLDRLPGFRRPSDVADEEIRLCHADLAGDLDAMVERLELSRRTLKRRLGELGLLER